MLIFLLGFMGSGKSTIGRALAKRLQLEFVDLDEFIEAQEGRSISVIFEQNGEEYFRALETSALQHILNADKNAIVSLGGGTPCFNDNMDLLKQYPTVYLKTSNEELFKRLSRQRDHRPLIAGSSDEQLKEIIETRINDREPFYNKASIIFLTDENRGAEELEKVLQPLL